MATAPAVAAHLRPRTPHDALHTPSVSILYRELLKNVFKELNPALDDFFQFKKGF